MRELVVGGLLISPFVKFALIAGIVFIPVRLVLIRLRFDIWFWHPQLAEAAIYVRILAALNILLWDLADVQPCPTGHTPVLFELIAPAPEW